jgi:hypothetical protein
MTASIKAGLIRTAAALGAVLFAVASPARTLSFASVATSDAWTYSWSSAERYAIVLQRLTVASPPCGASSDWCWEEVYPDQVRESSSALAGVLVQNKVEGSSAFLIDTAWAEAKANTRLGANRASAVARDSSEYDFELLDQDGNVTYASTGVTWSRARAESTYNEPFVASGAGEATFRFAVERHATISGPTGLGTFQDPVKSFAYVDGGTDSGALEVLLYELGGASPALVKQQSFQIAAGPGVEEFSFAAQLGDGVKYAFIVSLSAFALRDAAMDLYGTATLSDIQLQPGQSLAFSSGSSYNVTAVPEPATWALLLSGLALCVLAARRRQA